jgi:putative transposase
MYQYRHLTEEQQRELVAERRARGFPSHSPPHYVAGEHDFLLTAACYEHVAHMQTAERRQLLLARCFEEADSAGMTIQAWVVLPNHYHLLARPTRSDLHLFFAHIHGATSYLWNGEDHARGRKVWYRYGDRAIRSERHYYTTLNYLHFNPVKHGWAASPYDWHESSVHWYLAHYGREWLRDLWVRYPVREYGATWDVDGVGS